VSAYLIVRHGPAGAVVLAVALNIDDAIGLLRDRFQWHGPIERHPIAWPLATT
jgi:hypothetical protein